MRTHLSILNWVTTHPTCPISQLNCTTTAEWSLGSSHISTWETDWLPLWVAELCFSLLLSYERKFRKQQWAFHAIGFSDLVDLWVMTMILCARSTSRSREQSTKRRSSSENMWKVCSFYSQNNKHGRHIFWEIHEVRKVLWAFFSWLWYSDADWLGRQSPITWLLL